MRYKNIYSEGFSPRNVLESNRDRDKNARDLERIDAEMAKDLEDNVMDFCVDEMNNSGAQRWQQISLEDLKGMVAGTFGLKAAKEHKYLIKDIHDEYY